MVLPRIEPSHLYVVRLILLDESSLKEYQLCPVYLLNHLVDFRGLP